MDIRLFDYSLPGELIAQKPLEKRDHSRLLILDRKNGSIKHDYFFNIGKYLQKKDLLVINKSKVSRCRLHGVKENTGARIECFVLGKYNDGGYEVLLKPYKRLKEGDRVLIGKNYFTVMEKLDEGKAIVVFDIPVEELFNEKGEIPLPPYIRSKDIEGNRYQTVYAEREGSTASPTAGLHFTREIMESLARQGIVFARITLDIGLGTFRPVSAGKIEEHIIHKEYYHVESDQAGVINDAIKSGKRVVAIGTTSARVLETLMNKYGMIKASSGFTGIYIYPPYRFKAVNAMLTNFHLPRSTLLIMVSAFAGRENIFKAYKEAIEKKYRFYSFGDCMLIV